MEFTLPNKVSKDFSGSLVAIISKYDPDYLAIYNNQKKEEDFNWCHVKPMRIKVDNGRVNIQRFKKRLKIEKIFIVIPHYETHIEIWNEEKFWEYINCSWNAELTKFFIKRLKNSLFQKGIALETNRLDDNDFGKLDEFEPIKSLFNDFEQLNKNFSEVKKQKVFEFLLSRWLWKNGYYIES